MIIVIFLKKNKKKETLVITLRVMELEKVREADSGDVFAEGFNDSSCFDI